jgi:DtxR family transcriptional regulator, Mn-dependent transcriptional regulator
MTGVKGGAGHELTAPVEDYLKAIYEIESTGVAGGAGPVATAGVEANRDTDSRVGGAAGTNEIAQALGIAPASVTGMLRRLAEQGLITYERYRGVRLTEGGRRAALRTIRRHRVIEAYLTSALGYPWDRVHEEAERLEHAASDELIDRMAAAIGEPATDPHGAPIPSRDGTLRPRPLLALVDVPAGAAVRILQVGDRDPEQLRYLAALGITPGVDVHVAARAPFGGPITLRFEGGVEAKRAKHGSAQPVRECAVGPSLAEQIFVTPIDRLARPGGRSSRRG